MSALDQADVEADDMAVAGARVRRRSGEDALDLLAGQERPRSFDPPALMQAGKDVRRERPPLALEFRRVDP